MNILHFSDAHIQSKDKDEVKKVVDALIKDTLEVQKEKKLSIDFVCFSGDMIQRGDNALEKEKQWEIGQTVVVEPLLDALHLDASKFIFVPGNHEVDVSKINPIVENGLKLKTQQEIDEVFKLPYFELYAERMQNFYSIAKKWHKDAFWGKLGYALVKECEGKKYGFVCVDSAWRSSGKGSSEKGNIYVCSRQIADLYSAIKNADIKICIIHHPEEWFEEGERKEVEKELRKFDLVLRGHVHEEDDQQVISRNVSTIYSTAGKLYPLDYAYGRATDGYNGYSIISIDTNTNICSFYLRTYYANRREEFGPAENVCKNGFVQYNIKIDDPIKLNEMRIEQGVAEFYSGISVRYSQIRDIDKKSPSEMRTALIEPVLSEKGDINGKEKTVKVLLNDIVDSSDNIILVGKKESGKTTALQQIALRYTDRYEQKGVIPVYINMRQLLGGQEKLKRTAINFIQNKIQDTFTISKDGIKAVLEKGDIVYLIDNFDTRNPDHIIGFNEFAASIGSARIVVSIEKDFFSEVEAKEYPISLSGFRKINIEYLGKGQIRELVSQWTNDGLNSSSNELVEKIDNFCNTINFAKTPFNIAILMVLIDSDSSFVPINEGLVMENYLEVVLEKISNKEARRKTYGFKIKKDFLSFLAHEMYLKDEYYFTDNDFERLLLAYHIQKGWSVKETGLDTIFFEKNILVSADGYVSFAHTSFLEFFLANYALDDEKFLDEITQKGRRTDFQNEICIYAGLNPKCGALLESLSDTIIDEVIRNVDILEDLNGIEILTEFTQTKEEFIDGLKRNRLTQEEADELSDRRHYTEEKNPKKIKKRNKIIEADRNSVTEENAEDFFSLLKMYGGVLKNAELLDEKVKRENLEYFMYGENLLYAYVVILFEKIKKNITYDSLSPETKEKLNVTKQEEFEQAITEVLEEAKLVFPIFIQSQIYEIVGTPKLVNIIGTLIKEKQEKPFEKFMLVFLRCDLNQKVNKREMLDYIHNENSPAILKLILAKLSEYYKTRFGGVDKVDSNTLLELITEVRLKLEPVDNVNTRIPKSIIQKQIKKELDNA